MNFVATASINYVVSAVQPVVLATYLSPDGKWRVEVIQYDCVNYAYQDYIGIIAYEQLKLINLSDGTEKIVDDQRQNCDGLGAAGFEGLYWSPSNCYFYYNDSRYGNPEGVCFYLALPIYRLDTVTREATMIGGGSISPDETKLAMWQGNEIVIWDLDRGEARRVPALKSNLFSGQIWWSPNGTAILYLQAESDCAPNYGKTYITRLDLRDFSQSLLAEYDAPSTEIAITPVPSGVFALLIYPALVMNYDPSFQYEVITFMGSPNGSNTAYYIENKSLPRFDYEMGSPVLVVQASSAEWEECKTSAEKVLSALHVP